MFSWITVLKQVLSDVACMEWFMDRIWWWVWYDYGMEYKWRLVMNVGMRLARMTSTLLVGETW